MLSLYKETAVLALRRAAKAWPVAFSLVVFALVFAVGASFAQGLGMLGGFVIGLLAAACASGYLHLVSLVVKGQKVSFADLQSGFRALFWDVISVMFALWILGFLVSGVAQAAGPNGAAIFAMVALAYAFFLNPLPELIYLGREQSFRLLLASSRFVLAHPVAWFLPNVSFAVVLLLPTGGLVVDQPGKLLLVFTQIFSAGGVAAAFSRLPLWAMPLVLLFLHYVMVFRGLLFVALESGNNRRQRAWQDRFRP